MKQNSGFTLIELSVVLAIIGVLLYGSMSLLIVGVQASQVNSTVATMDAIEKALLDFRVAFGRIPCPADLTTTASSANYGVEAANTGTCTGGSPAANFIAASGTAEGGVPTRALRLPDSFMYDGWGHKFRYAVNPNYTVTTSTGCSIFGTTPSITVNDASGAARSTKAIYAIVSHGANGHGAYSSNGAVVNAGSTNADEQTNCHCDNTAAHTGGAGVLSPVTYVQKAPTEATAGNSLTVFDDIVAYKEAWQEMTPNLSTNSLGCLYTNYTRSITIDHTKVGTVGNTDQSSFPVLFSGTYSYLATAANLPGTGMVQNANGYDIIFTSDAAGAHLLPFERESWNATTGASVFWVQVPTVSHSADTVIYLQYGNPNTITDQSNKNGTWDSNYKAVWHMKETPATAPQDSTSTGANGTLVGTWNAGQQTAGEIDGSLSFDGSTDKVTASNIAALDNSSYVTVEQWWKPSNLTNSYQGQFTAVSDTGHRIYLENGGADSTSHPTAVRPEVSNNGSSLHTYGYTADGAIATGNWYFVAMVFDGTQGTDATKLKLYINGVQQTLTMVGPIPATTANASQPITLGYSSGSGAYTNGLIDEIRLSNSARSADWVITEYNNQSVPDKATYGASGFYTVGSQTGR